MTTSAQSLILQAMQSVEHPSIAASLFDLEMLSDLHVADDLTASCTLVLPFEGIPANMTAYLKKFVSRRCPASRRQAYRGSPRLDGRAGGGTIFSA